MCDTITCILVQFSPIALRNNNQHLNNETLSLVIHAGYGGKCHCRKNTYNSHESSKNTFYHLYLHLSFSKLIN